MKRIKNSYVKVLAFEACVFLVLFIDSIFSLPFGRYGKPFFMTALFLVFVAMLGFEKDKARYSKDVLLEVVEISIITLLVFYILGIVFGFYRNNYLSINAFLSVTLPIAAYIVIREFLRYAILKKSELSIWLIVMSTVLFIFMDLTEVIYSRPFGSARVLFESVALYVLPAISTEIFLTYLSLKAGYKPGLVYALIFKLYRYIVPIIPNPNEYVVSLFELLLPVLFFVKIMKLLHKAEDYDEELSRNYHKKRISAYLFPSIVLVVLVYFVSGYFKYFAIAVASGSMSPEFERGAVVIVDQKPSAIKEGEIIAFKAEGITVVHRIVRKVEIDNEYFYYTKGDANLNEDKYQIKNENIVGVVKYKIPLIGYPTVLFSEL